jgi:hypothetical protein
MKRRKKASSRVTAGPWAATTDAEQAKSAARREAVGFGAGQAFTQRQFQKSRTKVIHAHVRARGRRPLPTVP